MQMKASAFTIGVFLIVAGAATVYAESRVDLEIESVQIHPARPSSETPILLAASIRNNGSESVGSFTISVSIRQNGKKVRTIRDVPVLSTLPRLGSGLSVPVQIGKLPGGDYEAIAIVDPADRIEETNENNNSQVKTFHVSESIF